MKYTCEAYCKHSKNGICPLGVPILDCKGVCEEFIQSDEEKFHL